MAFNSALWQPGFLGFPMSSRWLLALFLFVALTAGVGSGVILLLSRPSRYDLIEPGNDPGRTQDRHGAALGPARSGRRREHLCFALVRGRWRRRRCSPDKDGR